MVTRRQLLKLLLSRRRRRKYNIPLRFMSIYPFHLGLPPLLPRHPRLLPHLLLLSVGLLVGYLLLSFANPHMLALARLLCTLASARSHHHLTLPLLRILFLSWMILAPRRHPLGGQAPGPIRMTLGHIIGIIQSESSIQVLLQT